MSVAIAPTFADMPTSVVLDAYLATVGPKSITAVRSMLRAFVRHIGDAPVGFVEPAHVQAWIDASAGTVALPTLQSRRRVVRTFFRWAVRMGYIDADPTAPVPMPGFVPKPKRVAKPNPAKVKRARPAPPVYPLTPLVDAYIDERARRRTLGSTSVASYRTHLHATVQRIGEVEPQGLTRRHLEVWLEGSRLAPATTRNRVSQFKTFCSWLMDQGLLDRDPTSGLRGPREPRRLPRGLKHAEVELLLEACPDSRTRLVVLLMVQEGLRRKEVAGLQMGDIDSDDRTIFVEGKGGHERLLPVSVETWDMLTRYLADHPATAGPLVRSLNDGRSAVAPVTVGRMVSALMLKTGVKARGGDGRSAHALRHTAAGDMLRSGAHLRDVQAALGHKSLVTTQRYLPLVVGGLREAMSGRSYQRENAEC